MDPTANHYHGILLSSILIKLVRCVMLLPDTKLCSKHSFYDLGLSLLSYRDHDNAHLGLQGYLLRALIWYIRCWSYQDMIDRRPLHVCRVYMAWTDLSVCEWRLGSTSL